MMELIKALVELIKAFWKEFKIFICIIAVIAVGFYLVELSDASKLPWALWRQDWRQDWRSEQRWMGSYETQKICLGQQWKKQDEELERQKEADAIVASQMPSVLNSRRILIQEGMTIFGIKKSSIAAFLPKTRKALPPEMETEIVATTSFFCAPRSSFYGLWPFYTPNYDASSGSLKHLGERTLSIRAKQILEQ
jgi:hypothetical protein